ncbi:MAG: hypothetical protein Q8L11_01530 [Candidatus Moranbacteria bacterium]|nr:hypothetical protein [Candidatus Moranbacteria bacterium]
MAENIKFGFFAKRTKTVFAYFHYPCGAAIHYKHSFTDILKIMADSPEVLKLLYNFEKIYVFLYVRRLNKNNEERQNTYLVEADMLKKIIQDGRSG